MATVAVATLVGGAFLQAFFQVLFERMASDNAVNLFKSRGPHVRRLLEKLTTTLASVHGVLDDAEEKHLARPAVATWLDDLRDVVYEADDLLDEIAYVALRGKNPEDGSHPVLDKVKGLLRKGGRSRVEVELGKVLGRLEYLVKQKSRLGLREGIVGENPGSIRVPSTSLVDESGVYGRDRSKKELVEVVVGSQEGNLKVVPIVGMGGVGKTTLAQLVYNDGRVRELFDLRVWVCVSVEFDVFRVTRDVLRELGLGSCDGKTPNQLQVELQEVLKGKRYLIVLDDVWNVRYTDWDSFRKPLKSGAPGSMIIVTTRDERVASMMGTVPAHELVGLSDDDCWLLFSDHAFGGRKSSVVDPELDRIGKEVVRKCKGLPLAAKTLGGVLYSKRSAEEWKKILKSNIWDATEDNILPALRLSYHYLPSYLKPCFAYCAVFPKDYEFEREELVLLWMAEGFLNQPSSNKEMEEVGNEYFQDLVSRSFFQRSSGHRCCYVMHDLMNDLATLVSGEFCFRLEGEVSSKVTARTRHLSYSRTGYDDAAKYIEDIYVAEHLRTFLLVEWSHITNEVMQELFSRLKRLRVLSLPQYRSVAKLPDSIGRLKHLRYLNLSTTSIRRLPETVGTLYNLQTLILHECVYLIELPDTIGKLKRLHYLDLFGSAITRLPESVCGILELQILILSQCKELVHLPIGLCELINLQHLDISGTKIREMPPQMSKLSNLKTLSDFVLSKGSGSCIKELGKLQQLQGKLCIWNLQDIVNVEDSVEANLNLKKQLNKLEFRWNDSEDSSQSEMVLELLQPCPNIESLLISGYGGTILPAWVGHSSFSRIATLKLVGCRKCTSLPPLGQLASLEDLCLSEFAEVVAVGLEFYGFLSSTKKPFGSLKFLKIERMPKWRQWTAYPEKSSGRAFPLLQELCLKECPDLSTALPGNLPSLTTLEIQGCPRLTGSLPNAPLLVKMKLKDETRDVQLVKQPSGLHSLLIDEFFSSDTLLDWIKQNGCPLNNLEEVEIRNHQSLKCFPIELFPKLKSLRISRCPNLEFLSASEGRPLPDETPLQLLEIRECPKLASFPEGGLPAPNLTRLFLLGCSNVEYFPKRMLLPSTLTSLKIWDFQNLKSLEFKGLQHLASLREMEICNCPQLQSLPDEAGERRRLVQDFSHPSCKDKFPESKLNQERTAASIHYTSGFCSTSTRNSHQVPQRSRSGFCCLLNPSQVAPTGHRWNHLSVSVSSTNCIASSPSPAASDGTFAFGDARRLRPWN